MFKWYKLRILFASLTTSSQFNNLSSPARYKSSLSNDQVQAKRFIFFPHPIPHPGCSAYPCHGLVFSSKTACRLGESPLVKQGLHFLPCTFTSPGIKLLHNHLIGLKAYYRYHTKANPSVNAGACKLPFRCRQKKDEKKTKQTEQQLCALCRVVASSSDNRIKSPYPWEKRLLISLRQETQHYHLKGEKTSSWY